MMFMDLFIVIMSFVGPILVGLFVRSGVKAQIQANENNISKQVREELEKEKKLLNEKIRIEQEDRWWKLKFDVLNEFKDIISKAPVMIAENKLEQLMRGIESIALQSLTLFDNKALGDSIVELATSIDIPIEEMLKTENLNDFGKRIGKAFEEMKEAVRSSNS